MTKLMVIGVVAAILAAAWAFWPAKRLSPEALLARYQVPMTAPVGPLRVYHLGHSLVGRDMPAMLAQMAGHGYHSQLGWGASLMQHWQGDVPGFAEENATAAFRAAGEALDSGGYDAVVLTEMVELRDAIRYHDSPRALANWAKRARRGNAKAAVYLYETWHRTDDPAGWEARIAADGPALWQGELLARAMADAEVGVIHVIPGGPVLAAVAAAIEAGQVPGLASRDDLFAATDGKVDTIHLNDTGHYIIALTHYAVLYHRSPVGMPHDLTRADGRPMAPMSQDTALALQEVVWQVVSGYPFSGIARE
ncbi:MAG: hypothetical protein RLZZ437_1562 [Pseudomonadota bacterium]